MIIVRLMGGMGNQMFQYALGRRLSLAHGSPLKLDCSMLGMADTPRNYELIHFNVAAEIASSDEIAAFAAPSGRGFLSRLRRTLIGRSSQFHAYEKNFAFDPTILNIGPDALLEGYWQSPKYFSEIEATIRSDFTFATAPCQANAALLVDLSNKSSVCIHIRRGDYISNSRANMVHGTCSTDYYVAAAELISKSVESPIFYVFSDDPDWVRKNFSIGVQFRCVDHNGVLAHEDLRLMSACSHFVIANSSFSWWAAWLGRSPNKIVTAPKKWGQAVRLNTQTRVPMDWHLL